MQAKCKVDASESAGADNCMHVNLDCFQIGSSYGYQFQSDSNGVLAF